MFSMFSLGNNGLTQLSCSSVSQVFYTARKYPTPTHTYFSIVVYSFRNHLLRKYSEYNAKIGKKTQPMQYSVTDLKELHVNWEK